MPDRVPSHSGAMLLCLAGTDSIDEITVLQAKARAALSDARDLIDDACSGDGFWSLATLGDVVGGATIVGGCLSTPFGWVTCGAGIVAGGGTIILAEATRDSGGGGTACERAEETLSRGEEMYEKTNDALSELRIRNLDCIRHHYAWWMDR